jgi:hypothetical protein
MATYDVSTVASQIQPPQATSLGDMLNIARGAQAYQQAQQVNPLIAQQQQTATEQAQFNLAQVKADKVKGLANSLLASQNWSDPAKMDHEFEFIERVAKSQGLDVTSPNNPLELIKKEYKDQGPEAAYQKLYQMTYGAQPQGTQFEAASKGVVAPPLPGKQQPTTTTTSEVENYSQPEKAPYQPPVPGQVRPQNPNEEVDRTYGAKYRQDLKPIQTQYAAIRQNYDKLIDQAEMIAGSSIFGGAAGTAERALKAKIGTPEYQQLSKDLANAQIAQIQAQGGSLDTVAGQALTAHANGSVIYDPKVLVDIARRNAANLENSYGQSFGADKASEKMGDANVQRKFRTEWNKNADNNAVFEMQYIFKHAKSPEEGAAAVAKYIKESGLTQKQRKELATKYLNLQKLQNEGSL